MANPYYIPNDNNFMDIGKMALQLGSLKQQGDIAARSAELTRNEQNMRRMELLGDTTQGVQGSLRTNQQLAEAGTLNAQTNKLNAETAATKISARDRNFNSIIPLTTSLKMNGIDNPEELRFVQQVKQLSMNPAITRGEAADFIQNNWDTIQKQTIEDLNTMAGKLSDKMMKTPEGSIEREKLSNQLKQLKSYQDSFSKINKDSVKAVLFYDVAQEEANTRAALAAANPKQTFDQRIAEMVKNGEMTPEEGSRLLHPKTEPTPKTDFQTFSAGFERKAGETDQQYNKRVSDEWEKKQDKRAMTKTAFTVNMMNPPEDKFKNWSPADKENAIQTKMITGKDQRFAFGDRSSYNSFNHEYNNYLTKHGITAGDVARMQADYKAGNSSLTNQRKNYDMMNGFAKNIDLQINKVKKIYSDIQRTDIRLLDKPLRDLRVAAKGSGKEANLASYLIEISNEIGKMSTGSAASIRELSESAQKQWQKIHDPNLSIKELMVVLNGTRDQAFIRLETTKEAMDTTRSMITGLVGNQAPQIPQQVGRFKVEVQ